MRMNVSYLIFAMIDTTVVQIRPPALQFEVLTMTITILKFPDVGIEIHVKKDHMVAGLLDGPRGVVYV